jgi:membrane-bound serine protease (ClpP class)
LTRILLSLFGLGFAVAAQAGVPVVEVAEVGGVLDARSIRYVSQTIESAAAEGREVLIIQLSSRGVVAPSDQLEELAKLVADPPLPVVFWVGPQPAVAYGGALQLLSLAPLRTAAPGTELGHWSPSVAGDPAAPDPGGSSPIGDETVVVSAPIPGLVDELAPTVRQLIQSLHGHEFTIDGKTRTVQTMTPVEAGITTVDTRFVSEPIGDRILHLSTKPEAAFFFLIVGLTVATFEFYAVGPGLAAGVAGLALILGGYGLAVLPVRWWAVAAIVAGWALLTGAHQRGGILWMRVAGGGLLLAGGLYLTDAAPQIAPSVVGVVVAAAAVLAFFLVALPVVARARFSTPNLGREGLVDKPGIAETDFTPDGIAYVEGASWSASAHRAAKIKRGDVIKVMAVVGEQLEIGPADREKRQ